MKESECTGELECNRFNCIYYDCGVCIVDDYSCRMMLDTEDFYNNRPSWEDDRQWQDLRSTRPYSRKQPKRC